MEKLLLKYLKTTENLETITIDYYNIDGANCFVQYFRDVNEYYRETKNINIWDMLLFLNN